MPEVKKKKKRVVFDSKPNGEILSTDWNECILVKKKKRKKKKRTMLRIDIICFVLIL